MKISSRIIMLLFVGLGFKSLHAKETNTKWDVEIPEPITGENRSAPLPEAKPIEFKIKSSRTSRTEVTEVILDEYRRRGLTETDWKMRTEVLNIIGLQWLQQTWQLNRASAPLFSTLPSIYHRFGRVAQEQSYYIDFDLQSGSPTHRRMDFFGRFGFRRLHQLCVECHGTRGYRAITG